VSKMTIDSALGSFEQLARDQKLLLLRSGGHSGAITAWRNLRPVPTRHKLC
jgi:hypothetical protein